MNENYYIFTSWIIPHLQPILLVVSFETWIQAKAMYKDFNVTLQLSYLDQKS